jgi:hypothetical protein
MEHVNLFDALAIEIIKGLSVGIQYADAWDDGEGEQFVVMIELGLLRILMFWFK